MSLKYIYKIVILFSLLPKGWPQSSAAPSSEAAACVMALVSSQDLPGVDDDQDPVVILEVDPCHNLVVAHNFMTGESVKYGDKYAKFLQATWGAPMYFPGEVVTQLVRGKCLIREYYLMRAILRKVSVSLTYYVTLYMNVFKIDPK